MSDQRLALQRRPLAPLPTPLMPAPRFSRAIGRDVLIKHDDIGSIGLAGNKVRKLELICACADAQNVAVFVVVGAAQSNAARAVAAVAAATGRRCIIVVPAEPQPLEHAEGNLLLSLLFGAEVRFVGRQSWSEAEDIAEHISDELQASGTRAMALPTGCSSPLGAFAFANAYRELLDQLSDLDVSPSAVVHASSSGGTAAGLHLGHLLHGGPRVLSVDVGRLYDDMEDRIAGLATEAARVGGSAAVLARTDVNITFDYLGTGYAAPTASGLDAIRLLASTEGVLCDPVYSGKALAAVRAGADDGDSGPVVFWHTGGSQSVLTRRSAAQLLAHR